MPPTQRAAPPVHLPLLYHPRDLSILSILRTLLSTEPPKHPHAHQPQTLYDAIRSHVFVPSY